MDAHQVLTHANRLLLRQSEVSIGGNLALYINALLQPSWHESVCTLRVASSILLAVSQADGYLPVDLYLNRFYTPLYCSLIPFRLMSKRSLNIYELSESYRIQYCLYFTKPL